MKKRKKLWILQVQLGMNHRTSWIRNLILLINCLRRRLLLVIKLINKWEIIIWAVLGETNRRNLKLIMKFCSLTRLYQLRKMNFNNFHYFLIIHQHEVQHKHRQITIRNPIYGNNLKNLPPSKTTEGQPHQIQTKQNNNNA